MLEYGNARRAEDWGILKENVLYWVILVDIITGRPIQYIIAFSLPEKKFSCYAMTAKNNFSSVFQFSTSDFKELEFRLWELTNHIPSLRERMLREYVYNESKNAPGRRWFRFLLGSGKTEEYLNSKVDLFYTNGKISKNELQRVKSYIGNLF